MGTIIENPILRGFHPDPSVIRVGEDYYVATSTFEWWPGVRLHHSRDLVHWELIEYPLNRVSQLDLRGVGASQGIWAPCLSYDQGTFYLVYTVVNSFYCNMYDTNNYLVTSQDIHGPWSEPAALNNFGFDPSLFHDEDGRKYMVSMVTDHRVPKKYAGRLVLQEYDPGTRKMTGPVKDIYKADRIFLEGPHIFKRNGWYYLFCITLLKAENKKYEYLCGHMPVPEGKAVILKAVEEEGAIQFSYQVEGEKCELAGPRIDGSFLSDEACEEGWFTGAMCGICCQDLTGFGKYADFDWFEVKAVK